MLDSKLKIWKVGIVGMGKEDVNEAITGKGLPEGSDTKIKHKCVGELYSNCWT